MILLIKIISSFLIPPGILIILSFFIYLLAKSRLIKIISLIAIVIIYFLSTFFGLYFLSYPLENAYSVPSITEDPSAITIVLSGGMTYHDGIPYLSRATFRRLYTGFKTIRKTKGKILISGGKIFSNESIASADLMEKRLIEFGIPKNRILVQDNSKNTYQDAVYSKELLKKYKFDKVYLVTSAMHMKRSLDIFKKIFKNTKIIAVPSDFIVDEHVNILQFFPDFGVFFINSFAIHEILGKIWYDIGG